MQFSDLIRRLQTTLNSQGEGLEIDGDPGPKTIQALQKYDIIMGIAPLPLVEHNTNLVDGEHFGAPWVFANLDLLGRDENDPHLNARYVPEWAKEGLPKYDTLAGNSRAWCSLCANADNRKIGVSGTNSAAASSWSRYGRSCPYWFGAFLPIRHKSGSRHVNRFLYWIDYEKKLAATLDGNKGNKFCVTITDLSGSGDKVTPSPRWPNECEDGQFWPMEVVLDKYPILKVGYKEGGGTR